MLVIYDDEMTIVDTYKFLKNDHFDLIEYKIYQYNINRIRRDINDFNYLRDSYSVSEKVFSVIESYMYLNMMIVEYVDGDEIVNISQMLKIATFNKIHIDDVHHLCKQDWDYFKDHNDRWCKRWMHTNYMLIQLSHIKNNIDDVDIAVKVFKLPINTHPVYNLTKINIRFDKSN